MSALEQKLDLAEWLERNEATLKPPVANARLFDAAEDFVVMVVGGPNQRTDYHVEPYEEWFYQIRGSMRVNLMTEHGPDSVELAEGQMWMLPRNMPHSPNRPAGSIGLVMERVRPEGTVEKFQWYCPQCHRLVHEAKMVIRDVVRDVLPVFQAFYADVQARTCGGCGAVHPGDG